MARILENRPTAEVLMVSILNSGGCLRCLYSDIISGELVPFQGSFVKDNQVFAKTLSGCAGSYVEYSVLDSQQTAIIACRLIISILKGKMTSSRLVSWVGNPDKLREAGFETSDHYLNLEKQGKTLFEIDVQSMPRCKICGE